MSILLRKRLVSRERKRPESLGPQIYQPHSPLPLFMFTDSFKFAYLAARYEQKAEVALWPA
jgi:hypothetical protein